MIYIFQSGCGWELQYFFQDLLLDDIVGENACLGMPDSENFDIEGFKNLKNIEKIIGNNIFIFSSNYMGSGNYDENKYKILEKTIIFLKPKIIMLCSDEYGNKPAFQELSKHTNLFLRQHYHPPYPHYDNIEYIPLGYMDGMMEENYLEIPLSPPEQRKYKWSFIGNIKKSRQELLVEMKSIVPNYHGKTDKKNMREIYRNSIFVPNGRGNHSLDCFRLYEASACGAIPVIVGEKDEIIAYFFDRFDRDPPWLFFESWPEAAQECSKLLENYEKLNSISKDCFDWWKCRVLFLRNKIKEILNEHQMQ